MPDDSSELVSTLEAGAIDARDLHELARDTKHASYTQ